MTFKIIIWFLFIMILVGLIPDFSVNATKDPKNVHIFFIFHIYSLKVKSNILRYVNSCVNSLNPTGFYNFKYLVSFEVEKKDLIYFHTLEKQCIRV